MMRFVLLASTFAIAGCASGPPPPAAAFRATGYVSRSATWTASSTVWTAPSLDGVVGTRAARASSLARILSPRLCML